MINNTMHMIRILLEFKQKMDRKTENRKQHISIILFIKAMVN